MKNLYIVLAVCSLMVLGACGSKVEQTTSDADTTATEPVSVAPTTKPAVCIWKELTVKEAPEEKAKYKTTIYLGEKIDALQDTATDMTTSKKNKYVKVRLIDNTEGWVRTEFIAIDATPAATIKDATIYKRPDMMTSAGKNFSQMDFVAIKKTTSDGWSEVVGKRQGDSWFTSGWVRSDNLTTETQDVAFSVFYTKALDITDETKRAEEIQKILQNPDLTSSIFYAVVAGPDESTEPDPEMEVAEEEGD